MRRSTRLQKAAALMSTPSSSSLARPTLCRASTCLLRKRQLFTTVPARDSSADKWRQRLWKSDPELEPIRNEVVEAAEDAELLEGEYAPPEAIETDLVVPSDFSEAARPEEVDDPQYVPAETAEGLEEIGNLENWWDQEGHWSSSKDFRGFAQSEKVHDASLLEVAARRAVVESLAAKDADAGLLTGAWEHGGREDLVRALGLSIEVAEDGSARLSGDVNAVVESIRREAASDAFAEESSQLSPEEAREFITSWDHSWKGISLQDPRLKFAVTKRILQLTGHIIPDSKLHTINNVKGLLGVLLIPPKPKKLIEEIQSRGGLLGLPNVRVYSRRVTPIDKDKMVGRWKVIVEELEKRELPVTGTGGHSKHMEKTYVMGRS